jgi:hypothetical protein
MPLHQQSGHRYLRGIAIWCLPMLLMVGCIIIPIPTGEKPYFNGTIAWLDTGITSKESAISELGVPDGIYLQGSELVYVDTVENWKIAWADIDGGAGIETLHKRHVMLLSFDPENILASYDIGSAGDDFGDCAMHGICLEESGSIMRYAGEASEDLAKEFRVVQDRCSIYLHGPGQKKAYQVSLSGKIPVNIYSTRAFIHWVAKPGRQSVVIWPEPVNLDFNCKAGEVLFVHFNYRRIKSSTILLEDPAIGKAHISTRRLVLLPTGSEGLPVPAPVFE